MGAIAEAERLADGVGLTAELTAERDRWRADFEKLQRSYLFTYSELEEWRLGIRRLDDDASVRGHKR
jgi:hypothetical protein